MMVYIVGHVIGLGRVFFFKYIYFVIQKVDRPTPKDRRQLTTWQVFLSGREEIFIAENRTANLFLEIWVSLHHHPVV
jgi:hypothetical protein